MSTTRFNKVKKGISIVLCSAFFNFIFPQSSVALDLPKDFSNPNIGYEIQNLVHESYNLPLEISGVSKKLPQNKDKEPQKVINLLVTAYSSTHDQTDGDPFRTAFGTQVEDGIIAANFLSFGTRVRFPEIYGNKVFRVEDRMHPRFWYRADIWFPTREEAENFGVKWLKMEIL